MAAVEVAISEARVGRLVRFAVWHFGHIDEAELDLFRAAARRLPNRAAHGHDDATIARGLLELVRA